MADERRNALAAGTEFEGYRIDTILGAGGFGITYRSTELLLNRPVAIKEFLPSGIAMREANGLNIAPIGSLEAEDYAWGMDRFRAEAQTLVAFRHPNIVPVLRYFETHGTGYLVMEYVEGKTLSELLFPDKTLEESEVHEVFDPLLDGLKAVHDKGFLHRDIKPANIFIRNDGSPVLIDFGAARQAMGQHSKSLTAIISEGYAPFEQYESSGDQGAWTDIYALGGVLYRCVTGIRPPDAPSRVSANMRGRDDPLEPVSTAARTVCTGGMAEAITRALAIDQDDRPQTIAELRALMGQGWAPPSPAGQSPAEQAIISSRDETRVAGHAADASDGSIAQKPQAPTAEPVPKAPRARWQVIAAALVILGGGGLGAWALVGPGESETCRQHARVANAAVQRKDLPAVHKSIREAAEAGCSGETLAELGRMAKALTASLRAAEVEKQQQADARRRKAEERRKREDAERQRREAEKKRREEENEKNNPIEKLKRTKKCPKCDLKQADLRGMNLAGADLRGANLERANLSGADLRNAKLMDATLSNADLKRANLTDADLKGAYTSGTEFRYATFCRTTMSGGTVVNNNCKSTAANRSEEERKSAVARLKRTRKCIKCELTGAKLNNLDLRRADLRGANLKQAQLIEADLRRANLSGAILFDATVFRVNLTGANLKGADLRGAKLIGAKLNWATLINADLRAAILRFADLSGANLRGANLHYAKFGDTNLRGAKFCRTRMPNGRIRNDHC